MPQLREDFALAHEAREDLVGIHAALDDLERDVIAGHAAASSAR